MRHICIYKCIVSHWNAVHSLWCYSHTWTELFLVVAWTSSEVVAAATARHHIWSPGVSVASISRYLLVFYYKLFYELTLNNGWSVAWITDAISLGRKSLSLIESFNDIDPLLFELKENNILQMKRYLPFIRWRAENGNDSGCEIDDRRAFDIFNNLGS